MGFPTGVPFCGSFNKNYRALGSHSGKLPLINCRVTAWGRNKRGSSLKAAHVLAGALLGALGLRFATVIRERLRTMGDFGFCMELKVIKISIERTHAQTLNSSAALRRKIMNICTNSARVLGECRVQRGGVFRFGLHPKPYILAALVCPFRVSLAVGQGFNLSMAEPRYTRGPTP